MDLPLSIEGLQKQWSLSFWQKLEPVNITELFWQLRPYVALHHVEFKESAFSFSTFGSVDFTEIVSFVRRKGTLGILLRNGHLYLFSDSSADQQCISVCNPKLYKQKGKVLSGWSTFVGYFQLLWWKIKEYLRRNIL